MRLPSHQDIAEHRVEQFKQLVMDTLDGEELSFYRQFVQQLGKERGLSPLDIASALTFLAQRERPLLPPEKPAAESVGGHKDMHKNGERSERPRRRERIDGSSAESGALYRIEVGRSDGVSPKDIVGAIANEGGIPGKSIGHIQLYDTFSTVSLPADLARRALTRLEKTFVMGKAIRIKPWTDAAPPTEAAKPRKKSGYPKRG